ncbi:MAG: TolC family protein [Oligoflexia bacterium]|nr:TolC family protein [Oligoflexia bacterium]
MKFQLLLSVYLLASLVSQAGPAQAAAPSDYTIDTAVTRSLAHSPLVRAARERLVEVEAQVSQAFSSALPSMNALLSGNYRKDPANNAAVLFGGEPYNMYDARIAFTQPLYTGGAVSAAVRAARIEKQLRENELRIAERDVSVQTIQAFYATLFQKEKIERLRREKARLEEYLATAQRRHREGTSRLLEVLQIKTQVALLVPSILRAENDLQLRTAELAYLVGDATAARLGVSGSIEPVDWTRLTAVAGAKPSRIAELRRIELNQDKLGQVRSVTLAKHYPSLGLEGNWGRSSFVKSDLLDDYSTSWNIGLRLTIPIFSGLSSIHERRSFASQLSQLDIEEVRLREKFSLDQIKAEKEVQLAQTVFETNRTALNLAREALREATSSHRLGTATYVQLFDSQRNFTEAEISFELAKYDYILAQSRYFVSSGWDLKDLVTALSAGGTD